MPAADRKDTDYVVLFESPDLRSFIPVLKDGSEDELRIFAAGNKDGALAQALKIPALRERAESEQGLRLSAVPARSWQPVTARLVPRDPVLSIG